MPLFKRTTKAKLHAQQPPIVEPEVIPNSPEPLMQPIAPMSVTANPNTHAAILNRSTADQPASNPQFLMQLQRQYGNRYVNQVVRQFRSPSNPVSAPAVIQPKLTLGAVGDKYEQEADRIAGQVVNQIHHTSSQPIAPGSAVQRERMPEDDEAFQRQPEIGMIQRLSEDETVATPLQGEGDLTTGGTLTPEVEASMNQFSGGQPLPNNLRQSIEQATGANFTSARVYTDNQADALNRSLGSVAATHKIR
ncbi:MAG: DUF4157 domain-containing protein [Cyanobacteria bacterium CRU_2_1]|nr:DUF4157 domain-containing protein [Cyanobacteria bacterium CRU_2_1]